MMQASWPLLKAWKPVQLKPQLLKLKSLLLPLLALLVSFNNEATRDLETEKSLSLAGQQRPQLGAPDLVSVMLLGFYF